jgi:DNA polymerase I-like protein with 3'-5' exonuclease and polymerase domains
MIRTKAGRCTETLPMFVPASHWVAPNLSSLPSWQGQKRVGLDCEFLDEHLKRLGIGSRRGVKMAGYSFAFEDGRKFYVPVRHPEGNVDCEQAMRYYRDQAGSYEGEIVGANLPVELDIAEYEPTGAIRFPLVKAFRDVLVADPLINELHHDGYSLEVVSRRRGFEGKDEDMLRNAAAAYGADLSKPKSWKGIIPKLPAKFVGPYGEEDAYLPLKVLEVQDKLIDEEGIRGAWNIESDLLPVLVKMRQRGVLIDFDQLDRVEAWARKEEAEALDKIRHITGVTIPCGKTMTTAVCVPAFAAVGIQVPMTRDPRTKKLKYSLDAEFMATIDHPVSKLLRYARQVAKLYGTFAKSIREHATNGRIHCTLKQIVGSNDNNEKSGAAYGRLACVARGTLIEVIRDVSAAPKGIPVEDVKEGDLVYSYDHNLKLCLRKVTWSGKTGTRNVVRIHWRGYGGKHTGHVDVTPDHLIRKITGEYVRADSLKHLDRVMALSRGTGYWGYERLWATGHEEIPREHRFIYEQLHGNLPEHVHHLNENKRDNRPENLEGLTAAQHASHHFSDPSDEVRKQRSDYALWAWENNRESLMASRVRGEQHSYWLGLTREQITPLLEASFWSVTVAARSNGYDFNSFKKHVVLQGFDLEELKRLNVQSKRDRKVWPFDGRARHHNGRKKTRPIKNNHQVISVEMLDTPVDVFDLTIEDTHNFIAGEICVHNCSAPNLQQQPARSKFADMWRQIYVAEPGTLWGCLDVKQQEPRWTTHYAALKGLHGAQEAARAYREDVKIDNHDFMASITGLPRKVAKELFLGLCYGEGGAKLSRGLKLPTRWCVRYRESGETQYFETKAQASKARKNYEGEATYHETAGEAGQSVLDQFNERAPYIRELAKLAEKRAKDTGVIKVLGGRKLHFPMDSRGGFEFTYKALNRLIQGTSGYQVKLALIQIAKEMPEAFIQLQIHDEIDGSFESISQMKQVSKILENAAGPALVPFLVDIETGPSWGNMRLICGLPDCHETVDKNLEINGVKETFYCPAHAKEHAK